MYVDKLTKCLFQNSRVPVSPSLLIIQGKSGPEVRDCTSVSSREDGSWAVRNDAGLCAGIRCLPEGQVASCQRVFSLVLLLALYVQMLLSHLSHDVSLDLPVPGRFWKLCSN